MATCDATAEPVGDVEKCRVAVGYLCSECENVGVHDTSIGGGANTREHVDSTLRPDAPVAKKTPLYSYCNIFAFAARDEGSYQIEYDVVVISGVQRNPVFGPSCHDA